MKYYYVVLLLLEDVVNRPSDLQDVLPVFKNWKRNHTPKLIALRGSDEQSKVPYKCNRLIDCKQSRYEIQSGLLSHPWRLNYGGNLFCNPGYTCLFRCFRIIS